MIFIIPIFVYDVGMEFDYANMNIPSGMQDQGIYNNFVILYKCLSIIINYNFSLRFFMVEKL